MARLKIYRKHRENWTKMGWRLMAAMPCRLWFTCRLGPANFSKARRLMGGLLVDDQNQLLRQGLRRSILEPVVVDLIRLYDGLSRQAGRPGSGGAVFASFADDVVLALERCGVDPFTAEPGDAYTVSLDVAASFAECDDPDQLQHGGRGASGRPARPRVRDRPPAVAGPVPPPACRRRGSGPGRPDSSPPATPRPQPPPRHRPPP